jgi:ankyrin repeat protein
MIASGAGKLKLVAGLLTKGRYDWKNVDGFSALMKASSCGFINIVKLLLGFPLEIKCECCDDGYDTLQFESRSCLEARDNNGQNALMHSVHGNNFDIAELLVNMDKSLINIVNSHGSTSLMIACNNGNYKLAKLLFDKQIASKNTYSTDLIYHIDNDGFTILMRAIKGKNIKIMNMLLDYDPTMSEYVVSCDKTCGSKGEFYKNNEGRTVLMFASHMVFYDGVKLLLEYNKESINAVDANGHSALDYAKRTKHNDIIELLNENGAVEKSVFNIGKSITKKKMKKKTDKSHNNI